VLAGERPTRRFHRPVGDEMDDALLGLEDPGDAEERSRLGEDGVLS